MSKILNKNFLFVFSSLLLLYGLSERNLLIVNGIAILFYSILFYLPIKNRFSLLLKTKWMFFFFLVLFFFLLIPSLLGVAKKWGIDYAFYLIVVLLPLWISPFYYKIKDKEKIKLYIVISIVLIAIPIALAYFRGIIATERYQQVGNLLGASAVGIFFIRNKKEDNKLNILYSLVFLVLALMTGGRQFIVGVLLVMTVYLMKKNIIIVSVVITAVSSILLSFKEEILAFLWTMSSRYNLLSVERAVSKYNNGGVDADRMDIYVKYLNKISFYPQYASFRQVSLELPHNFFLEYSYICGLGFGIGFILYILYQIVKARNNGVLFYLLLFYFVPFSVSAGITAAKYFLFMIFINIMYNYETKKNTLSNFKLQ